jgi:glycosyltransferase involved in cell wall biosynthesis
MAKSDSRIVLPDVSLAAIVRDEIMNPAGGIVDFVESTVPFVEEAVIVDTGSVDGTREALEELAGKYKNLRIFYRQFDGFDTSRNHSLKKVRTKRALVLDADERLLPSDFLDINDTIGTYQYPGYNFGFINVYPDGLEHKGIGHNPRLFEKINKIKYHKTVSEELSDQIETFDLNTKIKHFRAEIDAHAKKRHQFYHVISNMSSEQDSRKHIASIELSRLPNFGYWKLYNPQRENYR